MLTRPGDRVGDILLGDAKLVQLGPNGVGLVRTHRRKYDLSIHSRDIVVIGLADGLKDSLRQGDLVLAGAFGEHDDGNTILLTYFFTSFA